MARTKYERKRARRLDMDDADSAVEVLGIRKRDSKGRQKGTTRRERRAKGSPNTYGPAPDLNYRKSLFADGQGHLAWRAEAGYPLGVYYLREDLSAQQFAGGQHWAAARVAARRFLGLAAPLPRAVNLDAPSRGPMPTPMEAQEPSPAQARALAQFMALDRDLQKNLRSQHRALELCIEQEVMGLRTQRQGGEGLHQYSPAALVQVLDEFIRLRR